MSSSRPHSAQGFTRRIPAQSRPTSAVSAATTTAATRPRTPRQRGIYSEVVVGDGALNSSGAANLRLAGPERTTQIRSGVEHRPLSASSFTQRSRLPSNLAVKAASPFADVDPKVIEAHKSVPGRAPRKVRIERLRRRFQNQNIEQLLQQRDVELSVPDDRNALPLGPFDDTEYDVRSPEEWMQLGVGPGGGEFKPLPAQGLWRNPETGLRSWRKALVNSYDSKENTFEVMFPPLEEDIDTGGLKGFSLESSMLYASLPRTEVLFQAEDPEVFADRLEAAFESRRMAEMLIRYNFFVDNMPTEDVQQLSNDQIDWLKDAVKTRQYDGKDVEFVLQEVQLDFARAMNKVTFDVHVLKSSDDEPISASGHLLEATLNGPVAKAMMTTSSQTAPQYGLVRIPAHAFTETFASLCFATLRVRPEVVVALQEVKAECERRIAKENVFYFDFPEPLRLDEFRQMEKSMTNQAAMSLKDAWPWSLATIVRKEFETVGKGWFNMQEKSQELYRAGKLRRFLVLARLLMQSTLRSIAEKSVKAFVHAAETLAPVMIRIDSFDAATCNYRAGVAVPPAPSFSLEVKQEVASKEEPVRNRALVRRASDADVAFSRQMSDNAPTSFVLSTNPKKFVQVALEAFDAGLQVLNEVHPLERIMIPVRLQSSDGPALVEAFQFEEKWVQDARNRIKECLEAACSGPVEYVKLFRDFEHLLAREPAAFVEEFFRERHGHAPSNEEVEEAILQEQVSEEEFLLALPDTVDVGLFQVVCRDVRRVLSAKHGTTATLLLEQLVTRLRDRMESTKSDMQGLIAQIIKVPRTVEELVDMRKTGLEMPKKIHELREKIETHVELYELVESFHYQISVEDFRLRWSLSAGPKQAMDELARKMRSLDYYEGEFTKDLKAQEEALQDTLAEIDETIVLLQTRPDYWDLERLPAIAEAVESVQERIQKAGEMSETIKRTQELLNRLLTHDSSHLTHSAEAFEPYCKLWLTARTLHENRDVWLTGHLMKVDAKAMEKDVMDGCAALTQAHEALQQDENCPDKIREVAQQAKEGLMYFKPLVPLVLALRSEGMSEQHWDEISEHLGVRIHPDLEVFNLKDLCSRAFSLQDHIDFLQTVAGNAVRECSLERRLREMKKAWEGLTFDLSEQFGNSSTYTLQGMDRVSDLLDEQLADTQTLKSLASHGRLAEETEDWSSQLRHMKDHLEEWQRAQSRWQYLQPIFDSLHVTRKLPAQSRRFKAVDSLWRSIMQTAKEDPQALVCLSKSHLERWREANATLESLHQGLDEFALSKMQDFSRLHFLSMQEVLDLISRSRDPTAIRPFLSKLFAGVHNIHFVDETGVITAVESLDGESLTLLEAVITQDLGAEAWLAELEKAVAEAVLKSVREAVASFSYDELSHFISENTAQAVFCAARVSFTMEVESAMSLGAPTETESMRPLERLLQQSECHVREHVQKQKTMIAGHERQIWEALLLTRLQHRDVTFALVQAKVSEPSAFEWVSQIRHCWQAGDEVEEDSSGDVWIRSMFSGIAYGGEYLSQLPRIVVTPLTLRCQTALLDLQGLGKGGALLGPSGNGKSETIRDLSAAAGRKCVSFDCSCGLPRVMALQILKGAAGSGTWCCFEQLSGAGATALRALAQILQDVLAARTGLVNDGLWKMDDHAVLDIEGDMVKMKASFAAFATFRGAGLRSWSALPEGLAAALRPVAMRSVDPLRIIEVRLMAAGFSEFAALAQHVVAIFQSMDEQLLQPPVGGSFSGLYGNLRTVFSTVDIICRLYQDRQSAASEAQGPGMRRRSPSVDSARVQQLSIEDEHDLVVQALQAALQPGLIQSSAEKFEDLLGDTLPAVDLDNIHREQHKVPGSDRSLVHFAEAACVELKLQADPYFVHRVAQLHIAANSRHGMLLVGPSGSGKSACRKALAQIRRNLHGSSTTLHAVIPAAADGALLGTLNTAGDQWRDGPLAVTVREAAKAKVGQQWIVFDGPITAAWADELCPALEEERNLCLVSGEILQLPQKCLLFFEAEDLKAASPAFVCRCALVHLERSEPMWMAQSWLDCLPDIYHKLRPRLQQLIQELVLPAILLAVLNGEAAGGGDSSAVCPKLPSTSEIGVCESVLGLLWSLLMSEGEVGQHLDQLVLFAVMLGVGSTLFKDAKKQFAQGVLHLCAEVHLRIPPEMTRDLELFDKAFVLQKGAWVDWLEWPKMMGQTCPSEELSVPFEDFFVETAESVTADAVMAYSLVCGYHAALVGPASSGKSALMLHFLNGLASYGVEQTGNIRGGLGGPLPSSYSRMVLAAGQTKSRELQLALESKLERRRRGNYKPRANRGGDFVFFVDDLNMPRRVEDLGACPPLELLRQYADYKGWHRSEEEGFCQVSDAVMTVALRPGSMRKPVAQSLLRHFNCIALSEPDAGSATAILAGLFTRYGGPLSIAGTPGVPSPEMLASMSVGTMRALQARLPSLPRQTYCCWNLGDLWRITRGLCLLSPELTKERSVLAGAWCQAHRSLGDRLRLKQEQGAFQQCMGDTLQNSFGVDREIVQDNFTVFTDLGPGATFGVVEARDSSVLEKWWQEQSEELAAAASNRPLMLFPAACEHVLQICKAIKHPGSGLLLLGHPGSGRKSLVLLAAHALGYDCFQPDVTDSYCRADWRSELKACLKNAGGTEARQQLLLVGELQLFDENLVLSDVARLLDGGLVSELFTSHDDMKEAAELAKQSAGEAGLKSAYDPFNAFLKEVRRRLRCVLALNPGVAQFRQRLRGFPILGRCDVDWIDNWPIEALAETASNYLSIEMSEAAKNLEHSTAMEPDVQRAITEALPVFFQTASGHLPADKVASCRIFDLIELFCRTFLRCHGTICSHVEKLNTAVSKLDDTKKFVQQLKEQEQEMVPGSDKFKSEASVLASKLEQEVANEQSRLQQLGKEEAHLTECQKAYEELKEKVDHLLAGPNQAMEVALDSLKRTTPSQIREVRGSAKPSNSAIACMAVLCIILDVPLLRKTGVAEDYWVTAQASLLKDPKKLLEDIVTFDRDNYTAEVHEKVSTYFGLAEFEVSVVKRASAACEGICLWARALAKHFEANKKTEPIRPKVEEADINMKKAAETVLRARLAHDEAASQKQAVEEAISRLQAEQDGFQDQMKHIESKLALASNLLNSLQGQKGSWIEEAGKLSAQLFFLPGDALLCATLTTFAGSLEAAERSVLEEACLAIFPDFELSHTEGKRHLLQKLLGNQAEIREWHLQGLPQDPFLIDNGIMVNVACRWPFLVDPHKQGVTFVKSLPRSYTSKEGAKGHLVKSVRVTEPKLAAVVATAMEHGETLLIEEAGAHNLNLDLLPVLAGRHETSRQVELSGKPVFWAPSFRLILSTTASTLDVQPELALHVTELNFSLTQCTLEKHMFDLVMLAENHEHYQRQVEISSVHDKHCRDMEHAESQLLLALHSTNEEILDHDALTSAILATRKAWIAAEERCTDTAGAQQELATSQRQFTNLASQLASLVAAVLQLEKLSSSYKFSLPFLKNLLEPALCEVRDGSTIEEQLRSAAKTCGRWIFQGVAACLPEKHRLVFGFHLALSRLESLGLQVAEIAFLRSASTGYGEAAEGRKTVVLEQALNMLHVNQRDGFTALSRIQTFASLPASFTSAEDEWRVLLRDSVQPHKEKLPGTWDNSLNLLQKLCLFQVLRPDAVPYLAQDFLEIELGVELDEIRLTLADVLETTSRLVPMLHLSAKESLDPLMEIAPFAEHGLKTFCLTEGECTRAVEHLESAIAKGGWVLLRDCQFSPGWLLKLAELMENLTLENTHEQFRLFLTSTSDAALPGWLFRASVKLSLAPATGLRSRLVTALSVEDNSSWHLKEDVKMNSLQQLATDQRRRFDFGLCLLHCMCTERKQRFGTLGFSQEGCIFTEEALVLARAQLGLAFDTWWNTAQSGSKAEGARGQDFLGLWPQVLVSISDLHFGPYLEESDDQKLLNLLLQRHVLDEPLPETDLPHWSPGCSAEDLIRSAACLPKHTAAEVFGMNGWVEIASSQNLAQQLIAWLSPSEQQSQPLVLSEEAAAMARSLPSPIDEQTLFENMQYSYGQALHGYFAHEVSCFNEVVETAAADIAELHQALRGQVALTAELEELAETLQAELVPKSWMGPAQLPQIPLVTWSKQLQARSRQLEAWAASDGKMSNFWLGGLALPRAFFVAVRQEFARRNEVPLGSVTLSNQVLDPEKDFTLPEGGVLVSGLILDCCSWHEGRAILEHCAPMQRFSSLPLVVFKPMTLQGGRRISRKQSKAMGTGDIIYDAPLYQAACRGAAAYVSSIALPSKERKEVWRLAGAAVLLSKPDD